MAALLDDVTVPDSLPSCPYLDIVPRVNVRENRLSHVISRCKSSSPRARFLSPRSSSKVAPWTEFQSSTCPPSFVTHGGNTDLMSPSASPREDLLPCQNTSASDVMLVKDPQKPSSSTGHKRDSATHHRKSLLEMLSPRFARNSQKAQDTSASGPQSLNLTFAQDGRDALNSTCSTTLSPSETTTTPPSLWNPEPYYPWGPTPMTSSGRCSLSPYEAQSTKRLSAQGYQRLGSPYSSVCTSSATQTTGGGFDSCSNRTLTTFVESDEASSSAKQFVLGREHRYFDEHLASRTPSTPSGQYTSLPCDLLEKSDGIPRYWNDGHLADTETRFSINPCFIPSVENLGSIEPSPSKEFSHDKHCSIICDNAVPLVRDPPARGTSCDRISPEIRSSSFTRIQETLSGCRESSLSTDIINNDQGNNVPETEAFVDDKRKAVDHDEQISRESSYRCDLQHEASLINCEGSAGLPEEPSVNLSPDKSLSSATDDPVNLTDMQIALIKIRLRRHRKYIMQQLQEHPGSSDTNPAAARSLSPLSQKRCSCSPPTQVAPCCPCLCSRLADPSSFMHRGDVPLPVYDTALGWVSPTHAAKSPQFQLTPRPNETACKDCTQLRKMSRHCQRRIKKKHFGHNLCCRIDDTCVGCPLPRSYVYDGCKQLQAWDHCHNNHKSSLNEHTRCACTSNNVSLIHTYCQFHKCPCDAYSFKELKSVKGLSDSNNADPGQTNDQSDRIPLCLDGDLCLGCAKKLNKRCSFNAFCGHSNGIPISGATCPSHRPHSYHRSKANTKEGINRTHLVHHLDSYSKSNIGEIHSIRSLGNFTSQTKAQNLGYHVCGRQLCLEHCNRVHKQFELNRCPIDKIHPVNHQGFSLRKCHRRKKLPTGIRDSSNFWQRPLGDRGTLDLLNNVANVLQTLLESTSGRKSPHDGAFVHQETTNLKLLANPMIINSHQVLSVANVQESEMKSKQTGMFTGADSSGSRTSEVTSDKLGHTQKLIGIDLDPKVGEKGNTSSTTVTETAAIDVSKRPYNSCDNTPIISRTSRNSFISSADLWYKSLVPASKARYHAQISNTIRNLLKLDPYTHEDFAFHWDPDDKKKVGQLLEQKKSAQRFQETDVIKLPCGSALDASIHHQKFILYTI